MVNKIIKVVMVITLITATITLFYNLIMTFLNYIEFNPIYVFGSLGYIIIYFLCNIFLKKKFLQLNNTLVDIFIIFSFASLVLGEAYEFYHIFFFWDDMLHAISGILVSLLMFNIFYNFSGENQINNYPKVFIFSLIMGSTIIFGVFWEIFEFLMDTLFEFNMQSSFFYDENTNFMQYVNDAGRFVAPALVDTMLDLISEFATSIITSFIIVIYRPVKFYNKFLNKKNPVE